MTALCYDMQRGILIVGLHNPRQMILPPFFDGESRTLAVSAAVPTGNPASPYAAERIAALSVALAYAPTETVLAETDAFAVEDDHLTGNLLIPARSVPTGQPFILCILAADLATASGSRHIEAACVLRNPAAPIIDPSTQIDSLDGSLLTDYFGNPLLSLNAA